MNVPDVRSFPVVGSVFVRVATRRNPLLAADLIEMLFRGFIDISHKTAGAPVSVACLKRAIANDEIDPRASWACTLATCAR